MEQTNATLLAKFSRLWIPDSATGCWVWIGTQDKSGYGRFTVRSKPKYRMMAHRAAYKLYRGDIPEELTVVHLCDKRLCVNPFHLEAVTFKESVLRAPGTKAAQNAAKTHCPAGHDYSEENTTLYRGQRYCRSCRRKRARGYYARNHEAIQAQRREDRRVAREARLAATPRP